MQPSVNTDINMPRPWGANSELSRPSPRDLRHAFKELGTQKEVAKHFGVSKATIWKWQKKLGLQIQYHPEVPRAEVVRGFMSKVTDRIRVAQWLFDEGAISTSYDRVNDNTYLSVGGCMADGYVLERIGGIVHGRVNNQTKTPTFGWMPLSYVKILSAEAYAILVCIRKELLGLKRMEAEAALKFFPPSGYLKGRHTTDEFMMGAWESYAEGVVSKWSARKRFPLSQTERAKLVDSWIVTRVRRSRYFLNHSHNAKTK